MLHTILSILRVLLFWSVEYSSTTKNPSLKVVPLLSDTNTLILINRTNYENWVNTLTNFMETYTKLDVLHNNTLVRCDYDQLPTEEGRICEVDITELSPCVKENYFGYHKGSPCVFLNLSEIPGWIPEFYNDSKTLPSSMAEDLRNFIVHRELTYPHKMNTIWVSCDGEIPVDKENIGSISYYPSMGLPGYYYPIKNLQGYLSPLIAVHFRNPQRGLLINVECKAWTKDRIQKDREEFLASVHFELLID